MAGERLITDEAAAIKGDFHDGHVVLQTSIGEIKKGVPLGLASLYRQRASSGSSPETAHLDRNLAAIFARMAARSAVSITSASHTPHDRLTPVAEPIAA